MKEISAIERQQLRAILNSKKNTFIKIGSEWHLIENQFESLYKDKDGVWMVETLVEGKHKGRMYASDILRILDEVSKNVNEKN